ncbi:hypothetical protein GA0111570_105289 [Raineyella antarctica]|uniref:Integrase catalytic domain-containing protein n=1 Tax=Raineyella antarctica TaxID=1577474 RepID=A0A1G6H0Z7_9ACTN|nr:IS30 family transposase [Raineyella antarctica]SDB87066.1 hypothetical protein GA0111570_105289 [Raineyella antarctica]
MTLVERHSRYVVILGLPEGKDTAGVADVLIDRVHDLPAHLRGSLTWDQGTEMAPHSRHGSAVYFAHPRSPWKRHCNENTVRVGGAGSGLIREYLPGGVITTHQPYLNAIAEELNERPRAVLGYLTPREAFERLLVDDAVASTP